MYAHLTLNRDYPPRPRPGILHLMDLPRQGCDDVDVTTAEAFAAYVAAHPEIGVVQTYDSRFPQRPVEWAKWVTKHAHKLWPRAELLAAFEEVQRRRMADPGYTPTVGEALRHPKEFVDGMTEL